MDATAIAVTAAGAAAIAWVNWYFFAAHEPPPRPGASATRGEAAQGPGIRQRPPAFQPASVRGEIIATETNGAEPPASSRR